MRPPIAFSAKTLAASLTLLAACVASLVIVNLTLGARVAEYTFFDSDDYMRLQQVRDFMAGQPWSDTDQHRLATPEEGAMHFSRLPDLLLATFYRIGDVFVEKSGAEQFMLRTYPATLLIGFFLAGGLAAFRFSAGAAAAFAIFAATNFTILAQFGPGRIDHHALQVVLAVATACCALASVTRPGFAIGAAGGVVAMLAVGMETAPFAAATLVAVAAPWLVHGESRALQRLGFWLVVFAPLALVVLTYGGNPFATVCDAYGAPLTLALMLSGGGALLLARLSPHLKTRAARLAAAAALGLACIAVLAGAFSSCLAGPYQTLDPVAADYWLASVTEARDVSTAFRESPGFAATFSVLPIFGFVAAVAGVVVARSDQRMGFAILAIMLGVSIAVMCWQVRGYLIANAVAMIAIAALSAEAGRMSKTRTGGAILFAAAAIFLSPAVLQSVARSAASRIVSETPASGSDVPCTVEIQDFAWLAAEPPTTVFTSINLGAQVIALTPHRATAAPYHRNDLGIKRAIEFFLAAPEDARRAIRDAGAGFVLFCASEGIAARLANDRPDGMAARLRAGDPPDWLQPAGPAGAPFLLYRVVAPSISAAGE